MASNFLAYSSGTGVEIGMASAWETSVALGVLSLKTIVESSGVSMDVRPVSDLSLYGPLYAGELSTRYCLKYLGPSWSSSE